MQIDYTGRQTEVVPAFRTLTERKLRKLEKLLKDITHVHVVLASDKHRQIAEVSIQSRHLTLAATEESGDLGSSLATVLDKLARQAQRHVGRLRQRKRRPPARAKAMWAGVLEPAPPGDGRPRIVRSRRFVAKPMTVDEAALEVSASAEDVLVFRDAATEKVSVLFKRKDGNLGLIEPEA